MLYTQILTLLLEINVIILSLVILLSSKNSWKITVELDYFFWPLAHLKISSDLMAKTPPIHRLHIFHNVNIIININILQNVTNIKKESYTSPHPPYSEMQ